MKRHREFRLPPGIEEQIRAMARAESREYDDELDRLILRGLHIAPDRPVADEACLIAQLAYLHAEQIDESDEE